MKLTDSQVMALRDIVARYMRLEDEPQEFVDVAKDVTTTTPGLLTALMEAQAPSTSIFVLGIVSQRDKRPYVQLSDTNGMLAQVTANQARSIASDLYTMASRAEMDAIFLRFMTEKVGIGDDRAGMAMVDLRNYRHDLDMSDEAERFIDGPDGKEPKR